MGGIAEQKKMCIAFGIVKNNELVSNPMKHGCVSGLGCGCGTRQFLKKVGAGAAGLGD